MYARCSTDATSIPLQRCDDGLAELGQRLGTSEVAEPRVDPLDALLRQVPVVVDQLATGADHRTGEPEAPLGLCRDGVAVVAPSDGGDHLLDRHPCIADLR